MKRKSQRMFVFSNEEEIHEFRRKYNRKKKITGTKNLTTENLIKELFTLD